MGHPSVNGYNPAVTAMARLRWRSNPVEWFCRDWHRIACPNANSEFLYNNTDGSIASFNRSAIAFVFDWQWHVHRWGHRDKSSLNERFGVSRWRFGIQHE